MKTAATFPQRPLEVIRLPLDLLDGYYTVLDAEGWREQALVYRALPYRPYEWGHSPIVLSIDIDAFVLHKLFQQVDHPETRQSPRVAVNGCCLIIARVPSRLRRDICQISVSAREDRSHRMVLCVERIGGLTCGVHFITGERGTGRVLSRIEPGFCSRLRKFCMIHFPRVILGCGQWIVHGIHHSLLKPKIYTPPASEHSRNSLLGVNYSIVWVQCRPALRKYF